MELQWLVGSLLNDIYDAVHEEGDDGFFAFVGFQEGEAVAVVGVAAPAGGVMPFLTVAGGVYVDGDDIHFQLGPGLELEIRFLRKMMHCYCKNHL